MSFTPGPWTYQKTDTGGYKIVPAGKPDFVICRIVNAITYIMDFDEAAEDDARRIVTAVNAFDDMKAALTDVLRSTRKDFKVGPDGDRQHREAYAEQFTALSKAEGHIGQELAPDPERRVNGNANGDEE